MDPAERLIRKAVREDSLGHYARAEVLYLRSLRLAQLKKPGELRVVALAGLGNVFRSQGRLAEAETRLRQAMQVGGRLFGDRSPPMISIRNDLGVVYKYARRFREAAVLYRRALRDANAIRGSGPVVATIYHNLGGLEHSRGAFAAGEKLARRGLAIRRKTLGAGHVDVVADEVALGAILVERGKLSEAARLYTRALRIWGRRPAAHRYDLAVLHNNLGALYAMKGRATAARRHFGRALTIKRGLFGASHPEIDITFRQLAALDNHSLSLRTVHGSPFTAKKSCK